MYKSVWHGSAYYNAKKLAVCFCTRPTKPKKVCATQRKKKSCILLPTSTKYSGERNQKNTLFIDRSAVSACSSWYLWLSDTGTYCACLHYIVHILPGKNATRYLRSIHFRPWILQCRRLINALQSLAYCIEAKGHRIRISFYFTGISEIFAILSEFHETISMRLSLVVHELIILW